jgi:muramoyltetrapeptide carboxypeptidase LdcA involved in peptidoglycan recycling
VIAATRFGKPLPEDGTIGVASPASPYDRRSQVLRGVEWWEGRGYRVKLAPGIWERDDYVAGSLVHLAHAGKLEGVAGVVAGHMEKCDYGDTRQVADWARSRSLEDVLEERLEPLGVPVLYGLPLGHGKHLAALPLGVTCTLDADARTLTVDEAMLR